MLPWSRSSVTVRRPRSTPDSCLCYASPRCCATFRAGTSGHVSGPICTAQTAGPRTKIEGRTVTFSLPRRLLLANRERYVKARSGLKYGGEDQ